MGGDSCAIGLSVQEEFTPTRGPTEGILQKRSFVDLDMCYYRYNPTLMSKESYGPGNATDDTSDINVNAFRWRSPAENDLPEAYIYIGQFGRYDGGGFVLDSIPAGRLHVTAVAAGGWTGQRVLDLKAGERLETAISLGR